MASVGVFAFAGATYPVGIIAPVDHREVLVELQTGVSDSLQMVDVHSPFFVCFSQCSGGLASIADLSAIPYLSAIPLTLVIVSFGPPQEFFLVDR